MRARVRRTALVAVLLFTSTVSGGADADVDRAVEQVRALATRGDVIAQFTLAEWLYYGSADTAAGVEWLKRAAAQQYPPAEFQMGQLYDFGFVVGQSDAEALSWYRRAAGHGSAPAQRAVGEFYQKGRGVKADPAEAARWFRLAADGDDLRAQYHLGQMYFDGAGVERDYASAYLWFTVAAGQTPLEDNRQGLLELRNIAAGRLSPAAAAAAARRVSAWKPRPAR